MHILAETDKTRKERHPSVMFCYYSVLEHRRTSQGGWEAAVPQTQAKPLFFGQKLNFSGRSHSQKSTY